MRELFAVLVGCALLGAITAHTRQEIIPPNRCLPGQSCFPSRQVLKEFAATLEGSLLQPFDAGYQTVVSLNNNRLIRHPYIIIMAESVGDVQKSMKFARKYHLLVVTQVSTTFATQRSTYDGAMMINLSRMTAITGMVNNSLRSEFGELTAEAGATWEQIYTQTLTISRDVVSTDDVAGTVGDSIGTGQAGPLVKIYGFPADNLIEVQIVTADGNLVTVDEHNVEVDFGGGITRRTFDRGFFAAIADGGIGPWGVVVKYTLKLHPAPEGIVHVYARYKLWDNGVYVAQDLLNFLVGAIPILPQSWGGDLVVDGNPFWLTEPNTKGVVSLSVFYYGLLGATPDYYFIDAITSFNASSSLLSFSLTNRSSVLEYLQQSFGTRPARYYTFSSIIQYDKVLATDDGGEKFTDVLLFALNNPTIESTFLCRGNLLGDTSQTDARNHSFINPAMRTSDLLMTCVLIWYGSALQDSFYIDHALDYSAMFAPFSQGKSIFWSEDDLPDWKQQFHGERYSDVIDTKIKYDIDNFLWCPNCVGSDFRTDCRYGDHHRGLSITGYLAAHRQHQRRRRRMESGLEPDHETRHPYISVMSMED